MLRRKYTAAMCIAIIPLLLAAFIINAKPDTQIANVNLVETIPAIRTITITAVESEVVITPAPSVNTLPLAPDVHAAPYTIAWLSDTQRYSESYPDTYNSMTSYLKRNQASLNLGYVVHTGDIVNNGSDEKQWKRARIAMDAINGIPYGVLSGNHDVMGKTGLPYYKKYFGNPTVSDKPNYGGGSADGRNHFDIITLGNTDYLFVYLGYQPDEESMAWACGVFGRYPDRIGILCVHAYLDSDAKLLAIGKALQKEVVARCSNIFIVMCGHRYTEDCVTVRFDDDGDGQFDRTVYQLIANYQTLDRGGSGYMRLIEVDEAVGVMRFKTYSPVLDKYRSPPEGSVNGEAEMPLP